VALLKVFADVVNFCDKENPCISAAVPSVEFIMITLQETGCKGVVELKKAFQQNMNRHFYGKDVRQQFSFIEKSQLHVVATLLDPKLKMGLFYEEKLIRQSYCWFSWLQQHEPKQLKTKAKKGKNLLWKDHMNKPLIENIKKQTVFLPRLNTSCFWMRKVVAPPGIHLSQKIHMSKEMEATYLNVPKCKSNVCPLQV